MRTPKYYGSAMGKDMYVGGAYAHACKELLVGYAHVAAWVIVVAIFVHGVGLDMWWLGKLGIALDAWL